MIRTLDTTPSHSPIAMARFEGAVAKGHRDREGKDLLDKIEKAGVYEVSLKTLVLEKDGVGIDDRSVERLAESAARRGGWIHYPVVQKSTMRVIVGKRRVLAARKAKSERIIVRIVDISDQEASLWRLEENAVRFNPDKKELYLTFKALRDSFGLKQTEMAEASGFSQGYIAKILVWGDGGFVGSPSRQLFPGNISVSSNESGQGGNDSAAAEAGAGVEEPRISKTANATEGTVEMHQQVPESELVYPPAPDNPLEDIPVAPTSESPEEMPAPSPPATPLPEPDFVTADKVSLAQDTPPPTSGAAQPSAPSFSTSVQPSYPEHLGLYRGLVNAYVQAEIKAAKKGDEDARTHLHTLYASISEAFN